MADSRDDLTPTADPTVLIEEDAPGPPISVPEESTDAGEGGKLKMIVQLVKNCLGVKDIAAMWVLHNRPGPATDHCFTQALVPSSFPARTVAKPGVLALP